MASIEPGLLILHGNRLELLRDVVFDWIGRHPLDPLDEEVVLVQSNAAAEWLKMAMARTQGVCAATRVELPGRFLWRAYRQMLGRDRVPVVSALDRDALVWRLMRLLPTLLDRPAFAPVAAFLAGRDVDHRLQLARRLADLYDQYQVYRPDWLDAWQRGRASIPTIDGPMRRVPDDQRWQVDLWRALVDELDPAERTTIRPSVHRAFVDALEKGARPAAPLPRRVLLFGASHVSMQGLEALAALSSRTQVVFAIPNPCRYHWADIVDGREALAARPHRHPRKAGLDLATVAFDAMHRHAHPLLAAWGRQGRDFMQGLDAFDDAVMRRGIEAPRVDFFDDGGGATLLAQVQANIRDLEPSPPADAKRVVDPLDRSIVFQVAHSAHREVEILHDQLLRMLADAAGALKPRDIVVMVPDIERFAPSIRAVFGRVDRGDARFIPFDIADLKTRGSDALVVGLEWLLRLPDQRVRLQDVRDLLDVPAVAARFGIAPDALPGLFDWLAGAGVRWGLHERQRTRLGLAATGDQNSWAFGIRRMLLGYAAGAADPYADIAPYAEIGGLEAGGIGALIDLVDRLDRWWSTATIDATPSLWAERGRGLLDAFFAPTDERERLTLAALQAALARWLDACASAGFDEALPIDVLREAWLAGIDGLDANRRFMTGGVVFCTLMPLRAVPFEVVCLLGMNDGDFPRVNRRSDFDLMALPGQQRPGDRSRRDDDRYLMLEALLSARRTLYVGWCGRNVRDDASQPPSVLVAQLRDYLSAGWRTAAGDDVVAALTTKHPLQPFGRRYFEAGGPITYAREWHAAHVAPVSREIAGPSRAFDDGDASHDVTGSLSLPQLVRFLKNPVRAFYAQQLGVLVADEAQAVDDDEAFALDNLASFHLRRELLVDPQGLADRGVARELARRVDQVVRAGSLPMYALGSRIVDDAAAMVGPMMARWSSYVGSHPRAVGPYPVRVEAAGSTLDDAIGDLRTNGHETIRLVMTPSKVLKQRRVQVHKLLEHWIAMLAASACGEPVSTVLIACDTTLVLAPLSPQEAAPLLHDLMATQALGMVDPLPFAAKTAITAVDRGHPRDVYEGSNRARGEGDEFALRREYPDFADLQRDGGFDVHATRLFGPLVEWALRARIDRHDTVASIEGIVS